MNGTFQAESVQGIQDLHNCLGSLGHQGPPSAPRNYDLKSIFKCNTNWCSGLHILHTFAHHFENRIN